MNPLSSSFGLYTLQRLPFIKNDSLRAWDAADELLLHHVSEHKLLRSLSDRDGRQKVLLINDQFGALSVSLHTRLVENGYVQNWSDSYQSHLAAQHNLKLNKLTDSISYIPSTQTPPDKVDLVLIKIPKTLALLEDQLIKLKGCMNADTTVIAAGMVKHIHTSTLKLFEKILGTTKTSLATKKARLIFTQYENDKQDNLSPYPKSFYDPTWDIHLSNHANVFAKDKLDIGARFMLEQLTQMPESQHIVDLGCGNGVLGIIAQRLQPHSKLTFIDESYMAVDSARTNFQAVFGDKSAAFIVSDGLSKLVAPDVDTPDHVASDKKGGMKDIDLILCNPPFHQQHVMGDHIAWELFKQVREFLPAKGQLWVVGNRHLNYHVKMKRLFGNCRNIAGNKKFVVLASQSS